MERQQSIQASIAPANWPLDAAYRVVAELLLNPEFRDDILVAENLGELKGTGFADQVERFLDTPAAHDVAEYTQTLELAPPIPLYLGAYMYEEPSSCRGAGASGRNLFMIELAAIYEHFGFAMDGSELPDFAPLVIEFLAISLEHPERDGIGLRRRMLETYVHPALAALRQKMQTYESDYDQLIEALEMAVNEDLERVSGDPVWLSPEVKSTIPEKDGIPAPEPDQAQHSFSHSQK